MKKNKVIPHAPRGSARNKLKNGVIGGDPNSAPRCGAKTRKGLPCRSPAMKNGRCRMHGGKSTGAKTSQGIEKIRNANLKHGLYSKIFKQTDNHIRSLFELFEK